MSNLSSFFEKIIKKESIFISKKVLQSVYTPQEIPHREEQIQQVASILSPCLRFERPSNLFIYGKTGTGKTLVIKHVILELESICKKQNIPVKIFYINCKLKKIADTEYRLVAELARECGKEIPPTGLPTEEIYKIFFNSIDNKEQIIIIVLDEIDQLFKKIGDNVLYTLTRINSDLKKAQISLLGISNDLMFTDNLDPRVKSSLSEEELVFPPYNALQLQEILKKRSVEAFKPNVIDSGVIEKCAAYAAREHGDARRALELLRVAGEIVEREDHNKIQIKYIDIAEEKIEKDRLMEIVLTQPKQQQTVFYSIINTCNNKKSSIYTGEVYDYYKKICSKIGLRPLTQRRVSDIISELDMLGMIHVRLISKGRYGRTREISLSIPSSLIPKLKTTIHQELGLN